MPEWEFKLASFFNIGQEGMMPFVHFVGRKKIHIVAVLLFVALFTVVRAFGAEPLVRVWQTEEGLPQNSVRCVLQTKDGYLWIGTEHGLARFDGVHFLSFNSANTPQFKADHISALAEDELGNLWIGSRGGGVVRLGKSGFENYSTLNGLSSDMVNCLLADHKGGIWIGTVYGLNHLKDGKISSGFSKEGLPGTDIKALARDTKGAIWIGTDRGMASLRNDVFQPVASGQFPVDALAIDRQGDVWMGGKAYGLLRSRRGEEPFQQMLPLGQVVALTASHNGEVWAALNDGGLRQFQNGKPVAVSNAQIEGGIHCVYEDREKNLWIGLNGGGLARMSARQFEVFTINGSSRADMISTLAQDRDGRIWAARDSGGLALFQDGAFKSVDLGNRFPSKARVLTLCSSADGSLWIGTRGEGLFRWQNGNVTVPETDRNSAAAVITALLEDREGALWIGTEAEGILRYKNQKFTRFTKRDGFSRDQANCMVQQADGSIWFGTTSAGVNRWKDGRVTSFSQKDGLASDAIHALYADTNGMIWIGTSAGLTLFRDDQFFVFKSAHGLPDEMISQIAEDDSGNFWLGSNRGLLRVSRQDLLEVADQKKNQSTVVRFGTADGLPSSECIGGQNSTLKDACGKLWFSTLRGLVRLDAPLDKSTSVPEVFVERVLLNDEEVVSDLRIYGRNHSRAGMIQVPGGGAKLEIHFTATSLRSPEKALFRYKLEGFDPQWVQVGHVRSAIYTKIPKGNYTFRAAAFSEGIWGEQTGSVKISVLPQYWETAWFKAGIPVVLASVFFGVIYLRRIRRREVEQLRLRIAGDLHDELGSNLSSIALLSGRVGRQAALGERERGELNEISQIARQTIDAVREIVWFINPACDSLDEVLQRMKEVSSQMLADTPHQFIAPENSGTEKVSPEFRRNLLLAFKETLHNVVTHSDATRVEITANVSNGCCSILIRDNGKGFDTTLKQKGNGLKNIRLRLLQLRGTAEIISAVGEGTKVRLEAKFK